jgi:hypothetical protein
MSVGLEAPEGSPGGQDEADAQDGSFS